MKPILEIQNISKRFRINHEQQPYLSLRDSITTIFKNKISKEDFWALNDICFDVRPGDTVGIIGKNGAGKSTLLKILSKITPPTSGKIIGRGRIASLLEVGTGFHPELSGRENIFLNGSILGMRRTEILKNFDAIVDFAGVEKFIDTPLKHYSSGMQLRLAFAVAAFLENEILIIDEVLAVGDAEFQKKCMGKMEDVSKSGRSILFVSHNMAAVSLLCNKGVILKQGHLQYMGETQKVIDYYLSAASDAATYTNNSFNKNVYIKSIKPINANLELCSEFNSSKKVMLLVEIETNDYTSDFIAEIGLLNQYKNTIFTTRYTVVKSNKKKRIITCEVPNDTLCSGRYSFDVVLFIPNLVLHDHANDICSINIIDTHSDSYLYKNGNVFVKCKWNEIKLPQSIL